MHYEQRHEYEQREQQQQGGSDNLGAVFYGANAEGEVSTEC